MWGYISRLLLAFKLRCLVNSIVQTFNKVIQEIYGLGISVGIATDYGLHGPDRIPVGTRFSARPDRPCGPPSHLQNGYRVFSGGKVRSGRAADHSPPPSATVMEE